VSKIGDKDSKNTLYSSFCGTSQHDVRTLIAGPTTDGAFALSTAQEGLWAAELLNPESSANVTGQYSEILGTLDVATFERASRHVIEETEALRLCIGGPADQPQQWVVPLEHGPVRNVVGISSGIISDKLVISYYAARSNC